MIKLKHVVLPSPEQMKFVIECIHNSTESHDESDSFTCIYAFDDCDNYENCIDCPHDAETFGKFAIGPIDLLLMKSLSNAGIDYRKFMRMMPVMVRITAPLYWWEEFDTYKVGTVTSSYSNMLSITDKPFGVNDFSMDELFKGNYENEMYSAYKPHYKHFTLIIDSLNNLRDLYLKTHDKSFWRLMVEILPSSYNQTRNVMLNYEVLANIFKSRKVNELDEWKAFCKWIETLPYHELITGPDILRKDMALKEEI